MRLKFKTIALALTALTLTSVESMAAVEWNVSLWGKPRVFTEHIEMLSKLVSKKTKGTFKIKLHYDEKLSKSKENLDGISIGAFEMAQFCVGYHRDKIPTLNVLELPFLGVSTLEQEIRVSQAVYDHPSVKRDLARWNALLLMPSPLPQYNIAGVGKPIKRILDFRNADIRATGGIAKAFKALGATAKPLEPTQVTNSIKTGVVTSAAFAEHAHLFYGTLKEAKWWTSNLNPGTINCPVVINKDAFGKLSEEHKKILLDSVTPALTHYLKKYKFIQNKKFEAVLKKNKIEKVVFPEEDLADFVRKAANPTRDEWIKSMQAKGIPGQDLYDLIKKTIATTPVAPPPSKAPPKKRRKRK
ncbi:MAG: TRAP transporter substrate-binding protein DctP [Methyloligellaceae bacterium]